MGNIVITTHWLDGDVIPFIRIGHMLKERGHTVTLLTHCYFEKLAKKAGLQFEPWDTPEKYEKLVSLMTGDVVSPKTDKDVLDNFKELFEGNEVRINEYHKILKYCKDKNTVILAKNRSSLSAYMVAEKLQLPIASVLMNPTEVLALISYGELYAKDDMPELNKLRAAVALPPVESWFQWQSSPNMTIALWPEWIYDANQFWPKFVDHTGFPLAEGVDAAAGEMPDDIEELLFGNEPPILISGGTTKIVPPGFFEESIKAAEILKRPTIVLTRYPELLPPSLPDNVKWYSYLPLDQVMPYLGVLVHHGGIGTLSGALKGGIPQFVLPYSMDRPFNAGLAKDLGVGDYLLHHKIKAELIAERIEGVLKPEVKEKCKLYAEKMSQDHAISKAADLVEKLIGNPDYIFKIDELNRESFKSSGLDLKKRKECSAALFEKTKKMSPEKRVLFMQKLKQRGMAQNG